MTLPALFDTLRIPLIGSPLFIISNPDLVIAQCKAGIVGSFPALNAREADGEPIELDRWLTRIKEELDRHNQANPDTPAAPYAVNQIVHRSNASGDNAPACPPALPPQRSDHRHLFQSPCEQSGC